MAGSRAPSGSLRKIAGSVPKAGARKAGIFGSTKPNTPKIKPNTFTDGSDSDASSSSSDDDSNSGSDSDSKESISQMQKRISSTPAKTKSSSKIDSRLTTPAKSPTVNGLTTSTKKIRREASSEDESESNSDEEEEKPSKDKKPAVKAESPSSDSGSDTASESESESESESDETETTAPKPKAQDPTSASESDSESGDSESESEDEDEEDSDNATQQIEEQIRNDVKAATKTEKSQPPDEDSDVEMMDRSMTLTSGDSPTKVGSVPDFIHPDFHLRKLDGTPNASEISNFFSQAHMEGKQVWYITAPASLPVTVFQDLTIPMDEAENGKPVFQHSGEDYRLAFDNPAASSSLRLLIPNKQGDEYSLNGREVKQTMHFTRSAMFGPEGPSNMTVTKTITSKTKPARPQPDNLQARFTPIGVASPKPTLTAPPAATSVAAATSVPEASSKKKRKHRDDGEDGPIATTFITSTRKETPSGRKKKPTAEKSAKKQKTSNEADQASVRRSMTPVPVPTRVDGAYRPNPITPATRSRSSTSPGTGLPVTQVPVKQTPVPLPSILKTTSSGQLGTPKPSLATERLPAKRMKKEPKIKSEEIADSPMQTPGRKMTKVLPPRFDKQGRRFS